MKNVTYRWESLSPFDLRGTAERLSAMAEKGWRLERIGRCFWRYRRADPARVHYAVTCPPAAGENGNLEDRLFFQELCAAAGWEVVTDWAELQIYASEQACPTPLETDEALLLERVHRSMRFTCLRDRRNQLLCYAFFLVLMLSQAFRYPCSYFFNTLSLSLPVVSLLSLLGEAYAIAGYFFWLRRSRRSVEEGGNLAPVSRQYRFLSRLSAMLAAGLCLALLHMLVSSSHPSDRTAAGALLGTLAVAGLALGLHRYLKGRTMSRNAQAVLALVCVFILALPFIEWDSYPGPPPQTPEPEADEYLWQGQLWDREPREIPLTAEDLTGRTWPHVRREAVLRERSPFGSRTVCSEEARQETGEAFSLYYALYDVSNGWVYGLLRDDLLDGEEWAPYRTEDPAPWGADAAYQRYSNGRPTGDWLICWPGRLAELQGSGLEAGQIAAAARLAPEDRKEETR